MLHLKIRVVRTSLVGVNGLSRMPGSDLSGLLGLLDTIFGDKPQNKVPTGGKRRQYDTPPLSPEGQDKADLFGMNTSHGDAFNAWYAQEMEAAIAADTEIQALLGGY